MTDRLIKKIIEGQEIVTSTADTTVSDAAGLMRRRDASINDVRIDEAARRLR